MSELDNTLPTSSEELDSTLPTSSEEAVPAKKAAKTTAKKATKTTAKKATKATAKKVAAESSPDTSSADDTTDAAPAAKTAKTAAKKTTAKKATAKKTAAKKTASAQPAELDLDIASSTEPSETSDPVGVPALEAPATGAPAVDAPTTKPTAAKAPAKKATARKSAKKAAATAAPASEPATESAATSVETSESDAAAAESNETSSSTRKRSRRVVKESGAPTFTASVDPGEEASKVPTSSVPGATALLFQAPDPDAMAPRSRRAQAPAGPPRAADDETPETEEDSKEISLSEELAALAPSREGNRGKKGSGREASRDRGAKAKPAATPEDAEASTEEELQDQDATPSVDGESEDAAGRRRRRGGRGRRGKGRESDSPKDDSAAQAAPADDDASDAATEQGTTDTEASDDEGSGSSRRRRRRSRSGDDAAAPRESEGDRSDRTDRNTDKNKRRSGGRDEVTALKGSTRLEAKRQRRREGRDAGRRRPIITEAEFLARRESVARTMVVREKDSRTQIAVLEDGVLVEHYVARDTQASMAGNVYLGRVQNVLPSMEAAFVDIGKGRNAVLYAGEVNWDAAGLVGQPRRIEEALKSGDQVLVQVTKDPIGQKGARLTSQISLAGRYLVYVPSGAMTGISRKLPDTERTRLKRILKEIVPESAGVIVRTAAEGASEEELRNDVARLESQWNEIEKRRASANAPALLLGEPDLAIRVIRDVFNEDFASLVISGDGAWQTVTDYVRQVAPDLESRMTKWVGEKDVFADHRIDEQLAKGMDRKVWLPSGGSLVIDRTEAMTVIDVNTGKFTGVGGTLEETVTRNNIEAAEEIVRQLRLRDIGGIIVVDFIDMVLESNRDLVLRRLVECLGRDRTKHQVAEVTSLGLVQMTRKRVGQGLVEAFSETCDHCNGRGFIVHAEPVEKSGGEQRSDKSEKQERHDNDSAPSGDSGSKRNRRKKSGGAGQNSAPEAEKVTPQVLPEVDSPAREAVKATLATIAAAAAHSHEHGHDGDTPREVSSGSDATPAVVTVVAPTTASAAPAATPSAVPVTADVQHATPVVPIVLPERAKVATKPATKAKAPRRAAKAAGAPAAAPAPASEPVHHPHATTLSEIVLPTPARDHRHE